MLCAFPPMCSDIYLPALPDIAQSFKSDPSLVQLSYYVLIRTCHRPSNYRSHI